MLFPTLAGIQKGDKAETKTRVRQDKSLFPITAGRERRYDTIEWRGEKRKWRTKRRLRLARKTRQYGEREMGGVY